MYLFHIVLFFSNHLKFSNDIFCQQIGEYETTTLHDGNYLSMEQSNSCRLNKVFASKFQEDY